MAPDCFRLGPGARLIPGRLPAVRAAGPNGSGLRREKCNGMFFYFQAPRSSEGRRHFWRYIDAGTYDVKENRFEIAQLISCLF